MKKKSKIEKYTDQEALDFHNSGKPGKIEINSSKPMSTQRDLALAYSPGVAAPVKAIAENPDAAYDYTTKGNLVAVISNGSAILGLGNLGALASKPVMEGKAVLFKRFADIDAIDLEIDSSDPDEIINSITKFGKSFGGINLEDIAAPDCFIIEQKLKETLDIPVFHDDQHGTAVVTTAALINALKFVDKKVEDIKVVVSGAGAAGTACSKMILQLGVKNLIGCDSKGAIHPKRNDLNSSKRWFADSTNPNQDSGTLKDVIAGADVFVGVSAPNVINQEDVKCMAKDPIVFAMSNPDPEISPDEALPVVAVMATGRSDYPNQINNVLCFPGIFRGALDCQASTINEEMKLATAHAIAGTVKESHLCADYIIPSVFDSSVAPKIAKAVRDAAIKTGVARRKKSSQQKFS